MCICKIKKCIIKLDYSIYNNNKVLQSVNYNIYWILMLYSILLTIVCYQNNMYTFMFKC